MDNKEYAVKMNALCKGLIKKYNVPVINRKHASGHFARSVDVAVLQDKELTLTALKVYVLLIAHAGDRAWTWTAQEKMAETLGTTRVMVNRAIQQLKKKRYIMVHKEKSEKDNRKYFNVYFICKLEYTQSNISSNTEDTDPLVYIAPETNENILTLEGQYTDPRGSLSNVYTDPLVYSKDTSIKETYKDIQQAEGITRAECSTHTSPKLTEKVSALREGDKDMAKQTLSKFDELKDLWDGPALRKVDIESFAKLDEHMKTVFIDCLKMRGCVPSDEKHLAFHLSFIQDYKTKLVQLKIQRQSKLELRVRQHLGIVSEEQALNKIYKLLGLTRNIDTTPGEDKEAYKLYAKKYHIQKD
jgi:predicted transcriptional regulator